MDNNTGTKFLTISYISTKSISYYSCSFTLDCHQTALVMVLIALLWLRMTEMELMVTMNELLAYLGKVVLMLTA